MPSITITVEPTAEQWNRWRTAAGMRPDLATFLIHSADFYTVRLQARLELAQRLQRDGKLRRSPRSRSAPEDL